MAQKLAPRPPSTEMRRPDASPSEMRQGNNTSASLTWPTSPFRLTGRICSSSALRLTREGDRAYSSHGRAAGAPASVIPSREVQFHQGIASKTVVSWQAVGALEVFGVDCP